MSTQTDAEPEDAFRQSLNAIVDGVIHLGVLGQVQWMNRAAQGLFTRVARLRLDEQRRFRTGDSALDTRITEFCLGRSQQVVPMVIDCRSDIGSLLVGHLLPTVYDPNPSWTDGAVRAIVTLHVAGRTSDWQGLVEHFALTPAEGALANDIVHGSTLEQCAAARGTSIHTVRNQMRSLLAKTGTGRQSELVGLLAPFAIPRLVGLS